MDFKGGKEKEEEALLCLIALDDDIDGVYDSNMSCFSDDDETNDLYNELHDSLVKLIMI